MSAHALLLAAGTGIRFGSHKLLAVWRGRPIIAHVIATISSLRDRGAITGATAVVRSGDGRVTDLARQAGFRIVLNSDSEEGLSHSLRLGLGALAMLDPVPEGALVFLADQPAVPIAAAEDVLAAWNLAGGPVVRPRYEANPAEPGHPILLDRDVWGLADDLTGDHGLGVALAHAPVLVTYVDVDGANPDVDTPADLTRLPRSP
jgi:CTP:molybdopterin cytidylyltransferase MocA